MTTTQAEVDRLHADAQPPRRKRTTAKVKDITSDGRPTRYARCGRESLAAELVRLCGVLPQATLDRAVDAALERPDPVSFIRALAKQLAPEPPAPKPAKVGRTVSIEVPAEPLRHDGYGVSWPNILRRLPAVRLTVRAGIGLAHLLAAPANAGGRDDLDRSDARAVLLNQLLELVADAFTEQHGDAAGDA